jgi:hypothetical protein
MNDNNIDYLVYLNSEINKLESDLRSLRMARDSYLKFMNHTPSAIVSSPSMSAANDWLPNDPENIERKGLRGKGRTRDIFEFFKEVGKCHIDLAAKLTGYSQDKIAHFFYRYGPDGYFEKENDVISITSKGIALIERSKPYEDKEKEELYKILA